MPRRIRCRRHGHGMGGLCVPRSERYPADRLREVQSHPPPKKNKSHQNKSLTGTKIPFSLHVIRLLATQPKPKFALYPTCQFALAGGPMKISPTCTSTCAPPSLERSRRLVLRRSAMCRQRTACSSSGARSRCSTNVPPRALCPRRATLRASSSTFTLRAPTLCSTASLSTAPASAWARSSHSRYGASGPTTTLTWWFL